jgi:hypothetical protein
MQHCGVLQGNPLSRSFVRKIKSIFFPVRTTKNVLKSKILDFQNLFIYLFICKAQVPVIKRDP